MNPPDFSALPDMLAEQGRCAWDAVTERGGEAFSAALRPHLDAGRARQLASVLSCSRYAAEQFRRSPALLLDLLASGDLDRRFEAPAFADDLTRRLGAPDADLQATLRRYRQWHMLRILWRDFCRLADTLETVRDTSLLADAAIDAALRAVQRELESRFGVPTGRDSGEPQQLVVLAMGKLGARELNLSSDIDLMFVFPENGETAGGDRTLSNEEFFTRVGRGLIAALDAVTAEGFVFRVDMRLRPYGSSGALVHSFAALEAYYEEQGRDWERYALVKARPVTGDPAAATRLLELLRPFVYRRYVDFGVIDSLRGMKRMITEDVQRKGLQDNIKLGHGGIREIEFIAQCFQLIRGGRDIALQQRELLPVLAECVALGCLPAGADASLGEAYLFLRDSEHAIQGYEDRQTQALPTDPLARSALALVMGFPDWEAYAQRLGEQRERVAEHFHALIAAPDDEAGSTDLGLWGDGPDETTLAALGYRDPAGTLAALTAMRQNGRVITLQSEGRERLDQFMPLLLRACAQVDDPDLSLTRVLPLVLAVARRSAYLVLLVENPPALAELALLFGASPWIADELTRNPVLLDELLDRASLYTAPDKALLAAELARQVARLPLDDLEAQMDALRYFKASHVLRVAASELTGRLPLMQVSDKLTFIAEVILDQAVDAAWANLVRRYGEPRRQGEGKGFAVLGFGKLGGIELGHGSDLDLVFVSDGDPRGCTDGAHSIDNAVFYQRLGQRIVQVLDTRMAMGKLYEVDMRLRPDGESGMLVTTLERFAAYQRESAWTWEHQALVRARFVAGDPSVGARVDAVRREVLCKPRDESALAVEVVAMREKMRKHLLPARRFEEGEFALKQGRGGIVDIEFMVQYAVLAWSHREPELARWSDNVRILETLGREGFFEQSECDALCEAYLAYRSAAHQLSLQQQPGVVRAGTFVDARAAVTARWQELFAAVEAADDATDTS